jgi:hypothetical protein
VRIVADRRKRIAVGAIVVSPRTTDVADGLITRMAVVAAGALCDVPASAGIRQYRALVESV